MKKGRNSRERKNSDPNNLDISTAIYNIDRVKVPRDIARAFHSVTARRRSSQADETRETKSLVNPKLATPEKPDYALRKSPDKPAEENLPKIKDTKKAHKKEARKCVHTIYSPDGGKKRCHKKRPSVGTRRLTPPSTDGIAKTSVKEPTLQQRRDKDLIESKRIGELKRLSLTSSSSSKSRNSSTHTAATTASIPPPAATAENVTHKPTPRKIELRPMMDRPLPKVSKLTADKQYKPHSSFDATNRWSTLQSTHLSSTSTSAKHSLPSPTPMKARSKQAAVLSPSMATTIEDSLMFSEVGSLAPPNSSDTNGSRNTSPDRKSQNLSGKREITRNISEDGSKPVPRLKLKRSGNEFYLGFSAENRQLRELSEDTPQVGRTSAEQPISSELEQNVKQHSESQALSLPKDETAADEIQDVLEHDEGNRKPEVNKPKLKTSDFEMDYKMNGSFVEKQFTDDGITEKTLDADPVAGEKNSAHLMDAVLDETTEDKILDGELVANYSPDVAGVEWTAAKKSLEDGSKSMFITEKAVNDEPGEHQLLPTSSTQDLPHQKSVDDEHSFVKLTASTETSQREKVDLKLAEQLGEHELLVNYSTDKIGSQKRTKMAADEIFRKQLEKDKFLLEEIGNRQLARNGILMNISKFENAELGGESVSTNILTGKIKSELVQKNESQLSEDLTNDPPPDLSVRVSDTQPADELSIKKELKKGIKLGGERGSMNTLTRAVEHEQLSKNRVEPDLSVVSDEQSTDPSVNVPNKKVAEKQLSVDELVKENLALESLLGLSAKKLIMGNFTEKPQTMVNSKRVIENDALVMNEGSIESVAKRQIAGNKISMDTPNVPADKLDEENNMSSETAMGKSFSVNVTSKQPADELSVKTANKILPLVGSFAEENLHGISTKELARDTEAVVISEREISNNELSKNKFLAEKIANEQPVKVEMATDISTTATNDLRGENTSVQTVSNGIRTEEVPSSSLLSVNSPSQQPSDQLSINISNEKLSLIDELSEYNSMEERKQDISKDNSMENHRETTFSKRASSETVPTTNSLSDNLLRRMDVVEVSKADSKTLADEPISSGTGIGATPSSDAQLSNKNHDGTRADGILVLSKSGVEKPKNVKSVTYEQEFELGMSTEVMVESSVSRRSSELTATASNEAFLEVGNNAGNFPSRHPSSPEPLLISSRVSSQMDDIKSDSDEQDASTKPSSTKTFVAGRGSRKSASKVDNSSRSEKDIDTSKRFEQRVMQSKPGQSSLSGNHDMGAQDQPAKGKLRHSSVKSTDFSDDDKSADKKNLGHRQRSVKFSHTTVVGGSASEKGIFDLSHQSNNYSDDDIVNVMDGRSSTDSHTTSPQPSAQQANLKNRRFSIETHSDPLGYGMSSFLSARDSLEMKKSLHNGVEDTDKRARAHLSQLITEINAGKLEQREIRQLTNFAQKLLNAHAAGEVIGKHNITAGEFEVLFDSTPAPESTVSRRNSLKSVTDNVNSLISEIQHDRLSPVHMADLALRIVEACARNAAKLEGCMGSTGNESNHRISETLLCSLQSSFGSSQNIRTDHNRSIIENPDQGCRVKFVDEPELLQLVRVLQKLKAKMVLAPTGGSFTESIEKIIVDVSENRRSNLLYDAMILSLCLIITFQEWQNVHSLEKHAGKRQIEFLTKFDVLAHEVIVSVVQKVTSGVSVSSYTMEELLRLTALVSGCDFGSIIPVNGNLDGRKCSIQPEPLFKQQEEIVLDALCLIKKLLVENHASLKDLNSLALAAFRLQSKTTTGEPLRGWNSAESIWMGRRASSKLLNAWSLQSDMTSSDDVEISFITHFRLKLNGLQDSFGMIDVLQVTLKITELTLDVLSRESSLTDFWAAGLVLAVALIFDRIKSEMYSAALDYKILDSLINDVVYEAFNVAIQTLQANHIDLPTFQFLTSVVTKHRLRETSLMASGMSSRFSLSHRHTAASVSSPNSVIDFLESSLRFMRQSVSPKPVEIKALGDYALDLQHFYGCEMMARVGNDKSPTVKHWPTQPSSESRDALTSTVTPEMILERLDIAISLARCATISDSDMLGVACFVAYLVELPEKLARDESITSPPQSCSLMEYEQRLMRLHKITHYIPRFDFVIHHLEKVCFDLKNQKVQVYSYNVNILCLCIFVAYEWVRPEPLTIFAAAKMDDRAATVIGETIQSTLHGIKTEVLSLDHLRNLAYVISNTTDLRRASAVDVSNKTGSQKHDTRAAIEVNDELVLSLVDGMVHNGGEKAYLIDNEKLKHILMCMQNGMVSSYLYELLVLSVCTVAAQRAVQISEDVKVNKEFLDSMPKPDPAVRDYAVKMIKKVVGELRSGEMREVDARNITDMLVKQANERMSDQRPARSARHQKSRVDNLWTALNTSPGNETEIMKTQDLLTTGNVKTTGYETSPSSNLSKPRCEAQHVFHEKGNGSKSSSVEPVSRRPQLLQELCKDAINKLTYYIEAGLFDVYQLQNLSDILYQLARYRELASSAPNESISCQEMLSQVLTTTKAIVAHPQLAQRVINLELCEHLNSQDAKVFSSVTMPKAASSKNRAEWTNAQAIVVNGLETKQYTRNEMEILSHALEKALKVSEPEIEPVKEVELHGMMGKRPLHFSSDFLGETLSGFSIRPDGLKRYSYRSLVNPDLTRVEGLTGTPERQIGRRLSMQSEANIAVAGMAPFGEEERTRRRSSIPQRDFVLQGLQPAVEEEDDEEVDELWEASMHEIKVTDSEKHMDADDKTPTQSKEDAKIKNRNNSSCIDAILPKDNGGTTSSCEEETEEQKNNNANVRNCATSEMVVESSDVNKSPPSLSEGDTDKQVLAPIEELPAERRQKADITDSESSICPEQLEEGADSFESPLLTQSTGRCYPRPSKPGAKIVKKVVKPKTSGSDVNRKPRRTSEADEKRDHTVAERANSLAKAMSKKKTAVPVSRSKAKPKKTSSFKGADAVLAAYSVSKKALKK